MFLPPDEYAELKCRLREKICDRKTDEETLIDCDKRKIFLII